MKILFLLLLATISAIFSDTAFADLKNQKKEQERSCDYLFSGVSQGNTTQWCIKGIEIIVTQYKPDGSKLSGPHLAGYLNKSGRGEVYLWHYKKNGQDYFRLNQSEAMIGISEHKLTQYEIQDDVLYQYSCFAANAFTGDDCGVNKVSTVGVGRLSSN